MFYVTDYGLGALSREAKRRGMTYGNLVANTSKEEQRKIIDAFEREMRKKEKQEKENKGGKTK